MAKEKHLVENYKMLFSDLGVQFSIFPEITWSGVHALYAGYKEDFEDVKRKNFEILENKHVQRVVSNDPHESFVLHHEYGLEVTPAVSLLERHHHKLVGRGSGKAQYIPCNILHNKFNVEKALRRVLERSGYVVVKKPVKPIPCDPVFFQNFPRLTKVVVERVLEGVAEPVLITGCPHCYHLLKTFAGEGFTIVELSEVFVEV